MRMIYDLVDFTHDVKKKKEKHRAMMSPCTCIKPNGEIQVIHPDHLDDMGRIRKPYRSGVKPLL